jgi:hypothetical protein
MLPSRLANKKPTVELRYYSLLPRYIGLLGTRALQGVNGARDGPEARQTPGAIDVKKWGKRKARELLEKRWGASTPHG